MGEWGDEKLREFKRRIQEEGQELEEVNGWVVDGTNKNVNIKGQK